MAVALIQSTEKDNLDLPSTINAYISIRLWIEGDPPIPTEWWVIVGDFALADSARLQSVKLQDVQTIEVERDKILANIRRTISDYGPIKKRSLRMDVKVPARLIPK